MGQNAGGSYRLATRKMLKQQKRVFSEEQAVSELNTHLSKKLAVQIEFIRYTEIELDNTNGMNTQGINEIHYWRGGHRKYGENIRRNVRS